MLLLPVAVTGAERPLQVRSGFIPSGSCTEHDRYTIPRVVSSLSQLFISLSQRPSFSHFPICPKDRLARLVLEIRESNCSTVPFISTISAQNGDVNTDYLEKDFNLKRKITLGQCG